MQHRVGYLSAVVAACSAVSTFAFSMGLSDLSFDVGQARQDIISVVAEIQSIPIGGERAYTRQDEGRISIDLIVSSLVYLGIMQFDVEDASAELVDPMTGAEEIYLGGALGFVLVEHILSIPPVASEVGIVHVGSGAPPGLSPAFDSDSYELRAGDCVLRVRLLRDYSPVDTGLGWAIHTIDRSETACDEEGAVLGQKQTSICFDLWAREDGSSLSASYVTCTRDHEDRLLAYDECEWEFSNPSVTDHAPPGRPDDRSAPMLTLRGPSLLEVEVGSDVRQADPGAVAVDTSEGAGMVAADLSGVDIWSVGEYFITYRACDSFGNCSEAVRSVRVVDRSAPMLTLLGPCLLDVEVGSDVAQADPGAVAVDAYEGPVSVAADLSGVDIWSVGEYFITYRACDSFGNCSEAVRSVRVVDE